jgi:aspartate aminotransferase
MPKLKISKRGQNVIASPIRKFLPLMQATEKRGVKVYKLNTGDPDLEVPPEFFKAVRVFRGKNLNYAPSPGYPEHVVAWQKYYKQFGVSIKPENLIPTVGCAEAILLAIQAVADAGDEIIVFEPVYVSYKSFSVMTGVKLVPVTLKTDNGFACPPVRDVEKKISRRTKAIVIINPDNPTGKLWSDDELEEILKLAKKHNLFVIADETYREIRFKGQSSCLLAKKAYRDRVVLVDSVSKRYSMPGARIGCLVSFNMDVMGAVLKFAQARLSAGTLEQFGLIPLLKHSKKYTEPVRAEYKRRRDAVYQALSKMPGVVCTKPEGAFYIVAALPVDSAENFVKFLIRDFKYKNETVMISPMRDFYITPGLGKNEIRIAYVLSTRDLKKAMEILRRALKAYWTS